MTDDTTTNRDESDRRSIESLWLATTPTTDYTPLEEGLHADTVVVGGGITGLTAAIRLKESGKTVAVVEADRVAAGVTGRTTAKITSQHGLIYDTLLSKFDQEKARQYADANEAAIDEIERQIKEKGIDCDFQRTAAYVYTESPVNESKIHEEVQAAQSLGLPATFTETTSLPFEVEGAIRFNDQAQFHPRKYLLSITEAIHGDGSHIFEKTRALDIDSGSSCRVSTTRGTIVADNVVVASHFPFFDRGGYFARMHPTRAYLLAVRIAGTPPEGMYYSTATPPDTIRPHPIEDDELVLVGGQGHKPGLDGLDTSERYRRCEEFARDRFSVESVEYRWSTHDYSPVDQVPFVGQLGPWTGNVYVATGFNGWGITGGTAAAMIISDLIIKGENPWTDVFNPMRCTLQASAKNFLEENATVAARFIGDRATSLLSRVPRSLAPGEARIVNPGGRPMGVYRDDDGETHTVSAICPHMRCIVRWNDAEKTWDCPCHGSRFTYDGDVISGPAREGLPDREL